MCRQKISCDKKVERVPIYRILQKTIQTIVREYYPSIFVIIIIVLNQKKKWFDSSLLLIEMVFILEIIGLLTE